MSGLLPSNSLVRDIEDSEIDYMTDRMLAIQGREGNPEGIEIERYGSATCFYSRTMPWPAFNTVIGITDATLAYLEPIIQFYRERERNLRLDIVPSQVDQSFLKHLADRGIYQSGFHASLVIEPKLYKEELPARVTIQELREEQFELYAAIHCRGTGLPDEGIPYVAANNRVLYHRPGWKFYIAYVDGVAAAAGVMYMKDQRASLTFAATLPAYRNLGLQQLLLQRRIEEAHSNQCKLVVAQCSFLSQSHRNMERVGMKLGYVRTVWTENL